MKIQLNQNLSGNEVYYTNSVIVLVKSILCSKVHCHKVLISFLFHGPLSLAPPSQTLTKEEHARLEKQGQQRTRQSPFQIAQIAPLNCLDLCHKSPDSSEREYKTRA